MIFSRRSQYPIDDMEPSALRGVENGFIAGLLPLLRGGLRGEERQDGTGQAALFVPERQQFRA